MLQLAILHACLCLSAATIYTAIMHCSSAASAKGLHEPAQWHLQKRVNQSSLLYDNRKDVTSMDLLALEDKVPLHLQVTNQHAVRLWNVQKLCNSLCLSEVDPLPVALCCSSDMALQTVAFFIARRIISLGDGISCRVGKS